MTSIEILISAIGVLVSLVGYLANRQLQRVDDKVTKVENEFFDVKSKVINITELSRLDKKAMLDHLEFELMPKLQSKGLEDEMAKVRTEIVILKEYQQKRISPALENVIKMNHAIESQAKKQKDSDEITYKMYEVVKKLMEKSKNDSAD
jgi:hypothetical protein